MNENSGQDGKIDKMRVFLKLTGKTLEPDRIKKIINILCFNENKALTFKQFQKETGIPYGSLRNNLNKLHDTGLLSKTPESPTKYAMTNLLVSILKIPTKISSEISSEYSECSQKK